MRMGLVKVILLLIKKHELVAPRKKNSGAVKSSSLDNNKRASGLELIAHLMSS